MAGSIDVTGSDPVSTTILQASAVQIGGAGKVMLDLHHEYIRRGLDSWVAVGKARHSEPHLLEIPNEEMRSRWTATIGRLGGSGKGPGGRSAGEKALLVASDPQRYLAILSGVEDFAYPGSRRLLGLPPHPPDVLHLHNLHGYYFDLRALPEISRRLPTVLTMHDAWLLTGHCAHPFDCPRWTDGCGECPDIGMYVPIRKDASAKNWQLKRDVLGRSRLGLVSPSRWLLEMVERTLPLGPDLTVRLIPNGVDTNVFRPGDQLAARGELGLPADATILLASAETLVDNPFKDFETLRSALSRMGADTPGDVVFVALGADRNIDPIPGIRAVAVPFVDDPRRVALFYQAADVYAHAARAENLPLTITEAMACGRPVVASDVGGIGELVIDGKTGFLVPPGDVDALASALRTLSTDRDLREKLGREGAARVLEHFTLERAAADYLDLYLELRSEWGALV